MFENFLSVKRITESALVAVLNVLNDPLHWMIIEDEHQKWNFKSGKVEVGKSKKISSQKMFEKIISDKMDHRVSISSSNECIEWPIVLNDHWRWKWKMKFEISKVEKLKSENQ